MKKVIDRAALEELLFKKYGDTARVMLEKADSSYSKEDMMKNLLSAGLKIKHKESGLRYTIDSVTDQIITLLTPEQRQVTLPKAEVEKDYVLD
jgi:hypothetical protein